MQAKDVPDLPVLQWLAGRGLHFSTWCDWPETSVLAAMPPGTPPKVALAKMRRLIARGLVTGCGCGCRGDFQLSKKGREAVVAAQVARAS